MRRKLTAGIAPAPAPGVAAMMAAVAIVLAGCSAATPMTGSSGPAAGASSGASTVAGPSSSQLSLFSDTPPTSTPPEPASRTLTGLSDACTAVLEAQLAIAGLFAKPVDGHKLSGADVRTVFAGIDPKVPRHLDGDIATLHDAATEAVGKSDVQVAAILAEKKVAGAMGALAAFVKGCAPGTG